MVAEEDEIGAMLDCAEKDETGVMLDCAEELDAKAFANDGWFEQVVCLPDRNLKGAARERVIKERAISGKCTSTVSATICSKECGSRK